RGRRCRPVARGPVRGPGPARAGRRRRGRRAAAGRGPRRAVSVVGGLIVGFLAGRLAWVTLAPAFAHPLLRREDYRGRAVGPAAGRSGGRLVADAALVALSANLGNLLDRAPGRTTKAGVAAFAALAVGTGGAHVLGGVAVVTGAALALLLDDLHERLMLG